MPMIDPFTPDAFSLNTLTAAINNLPYAPGRLGALGLFEENGISTLDATIEERDGVLTLVPVTPRGSAGTPISDRPRRIRTFRVPHLQEEATIMADEVQGVRAFGTDATAETLQTRVNERLQMMRRNIDYTIEAHRLAAIQGQFYDANGGQQSLFTAFGVTQTTHTVPFSNAATKMRVESLNILELIEAALDGVPFSGVRVFCSSGFWNQLVAHPTIEQTYLNTQMAASLRGDPRLEFEFGGILWERYRGNSQVFIPNNEAIAVPMGVPGLFITRFAPADYAETVNTIGLPYYARSEPLPMNKGYRLEAQSNVINLCTRPAALIRLVAA